MKSTLSRWQHNCNLKDFHDYFVKQWVNSDFKNCQIFQTPPRFAKTNNPLEQYNCRIKDDFAKRIKHHLISSLNIFKELVNNESENLFTIQSFPKVSKLLKDSDTSIVKNKNLLFNENSTYKYQHEDGTFSVICLATKTCTCSSFMDKAICKHLVAACLKTNTNLPRLVFMPIVFVSRWKEKEENF